MLFLLNNGCPETYRLRAPLCFRQFVRTVQCVASWNAQQHIIVLLLQTSIVSLLFIKWPFIGRKVLFLDAFLHSSRLDLPGLNKGRPSLFSLCSWRENGEHKRWNFCVFFNGDVESLLHSALEQKPRPFETLHGSQGKRPHTLTMGEARARVCLEAAFSASPSNQPRTHVRERRTAVERSHIGQGRKPALQGLQCSPGSQEMRLRSQVGTWMGDGGVSLCVRPAAPQQARNLLKQSSPKPKKHIPYRLEKPCRIDCTTSRTASCTISVISIWERFTQCKS